MRSRVRRPLDNGESVDGIRLKSVTDDVVATVEESSLGKANEVRTAVVAGLSARLRRFFCNGRLRFWKLMIET